MNPQQVLFDLLDGYAADGSTMRIDEIQAFLLVWLSGPDDVEENFDAVLSEVVGGAPLDENQTASVGNALRRWMDILRQELAAGKLPDLLILDDEDGKADFFSWCNAYLYALDMTKTDWFEAADNDEFEDLFYPIMVLGGIYDEDEANVLGGLSESETGRLQNELPYAVRDIFAFWRVLANKPQTVRREGKKVGRNDICPCGSGRKYKACCDRG